MPCTLVGISTVVFVSSDLLDVGTRVSSGLERDPSHGLVGKGTLVFVSSLSRCRYSRLVYSRDGP